MHIYIFRFITTEELEQALREYGMQDGRDIKEIISEVDGDNVSTSKRGLKAFVVKVFASIYALKFSIFFHFLHA